MAHHNCCVPNCIIKVSEMQLSFVITAFLKDATTPGMSFAAVRHAFSPPYNDPLSLYSHRSYQSLARLEPGGDSHMKGAGMFFRNFSLNPLKRPIWAWQNLFLTP